MYYTLCNCCHDGDFNWRHAQNEYEAKKKNDNILSKCFLVDLVTGFSMCAARFLVKNPSETLLGSLLAQAAQHVQKEFEPKSPTSYATQTAATVQYSLLVVGSDGEANTVLWHGADNSAPQTVTGVRAEAQKFTSSVIKESELQHTGPQSRQARKNHIMVALGRWNRCKEKSLDFIRQDTCAHTHTHTHTHTRTPTCAQ